jgi:2'-5' RNA ligase
MAAGDGLSAGEAPFVLTLELDGESFARLEELRRRYYPPERNLVPAHVTLFHQLPGGRGREVKALLQRVAAGQKPFEIEAAGVKALESGVGVFLRSAQLHSLRDRLADEWEPWLTEQDRAGFRPHATIQTNVGERQARDTQREIEAAWRPPRMRAVGLHLWRYRSGPWESVQVYRFR